MLSDNEIREAIRKFRERHSLLYERAQNCPFTMVRRSYIGNCACRRIMGAVSPQPPLIKVCYADRYRYMLDYFTCPCRLYGEEHVIKKVKEFMGEI